MPTPATHAMAPPFDGMRFAQFADTLPDDDTDRDKQDAGIQQRNEHRTLLVSVRIFRIGFYPCQFEGQQCQYEADHIAQVMTCIGNQRYGVQKKTGS